jgi:hypothetical protein
MKMISSATPTTAMNAVSAVFEPATASGGGVTWLIT